MSRSSPWRKIVVNDKNYRWRGRQHFVIQDENGKRIAGFHNIEISHKYTNPITPGKIKKIILQTMDL